MSFTFPPFTVTFDDGTVTDIQVMKIDLLRLERAEKISLANYEFGLDGIYKLSWLALQRLKNDRVQPFLDLSELTLSRLHAGVDALAEIADIETTEDGEVEVGKASGQDLTTG